MTLLHETLRTQMLELYGLNMQTNPNKLRMQ